MNPLSELGKGIAAESRSATTGTAWPNGPFQKLGRWIIDASGTNFTYAGVSWPAHAETMLSEGLQYQSVAAITALVNALGRENGTAVLESVLKNNPSFSKTTKRLQVFDAVASECAKQEIYVHLDNHLSKAGWCCNPFDGSAWWGDTYFSAVNWARGLGYMAQHGLPLTGSASSKTLAKVFDAAADFASGLADKLVLELHTYINPATCSALEARLDCVIIPCIFPL
ncbi:hypothetical protein B0T24DRAFT_699250 [Lasiosphaeria ovina]|uniref:Glycoside hydrolase family 5 domain-containing protein n=1 Tax=Lasiosphaeria ovina TaxID=92902 RepID=A0AAE0KGI7_9PEZI|nr:hypothetical protein B0T24DRAFT_699250 [Lasiosphaeria ovina]